MTAPAGAIVGLYVDLVAVVWPGDLIETRSGRRYLVMANRRQARGKHEGRQHLRCTVLGDDVGPSALVGRVVHRIRWYKRGRGKR